MVHQEQDHKQNGSRDFSALSSIAPALASTACCWGPAVLSTFGAASSSTSATLSRVSQYRPHLLTLSVTMISYSFYRVYGPPSKHERECCKTEEEKEAHARKLNINRAVVWASLGVAVLGASYGRVALPKKSQLFAPFQTQTGAVGSGAVAGLGAKNIISSQRPIMLNLQVEGMHCVGCSTRVRNAIESVAGVQKADVDHETGSVVIETIAGDVDQEAIKSAIAKTGYSISPGS